MRLSDRKKLIKVLLLMIENNCMLESLSSMTDRSINRHKAIKILSEMLHIPQRELDDLYEKHLINKLRS